MNEEDDSPETPAPPPLYEVEEVPLERRLVSDRRGRAARKLALIESGPAPAPAGAAPAEPERRRSRDRRQRRRADDAPDAQGAPGSPDARETDEPI